MSAIDGMAPAERAASRGATYAVVALGSLAIVVPSLSYLHISTPVSAVNPLRQTISDYVSVPYGAAMLVLISAAAIVAVAALSRTLVGLPGIGIVQLVLLSWCIAVAIGAIFPTNMPGTPSDLSAVLHRYSGGWHFATLPIAGLLLARRIRDVPEWRSSARGLHRLALATGVLSATFLISHIPVVFQFGSPDVLPLGLVERVLFVMELVLLAGIAVAAWQAAGNRGAAR